MTWRPDLTVAAVVLRDDRFLLIEERIQGRVVLNQPAGHVEDGESLLDAVVRETLEETAWRFTPRHLLGCYLWRNPVGGRTTLRVAIVGDVADHDPQRRLDRGILGTRWLTYGELLDEQARVRSPLVLRCIEDFRAGDRHDLSALAYLAELPAAVEAAPTPPPRA